MSNKSDIDLVISAHTEGLGGVKQALKSISGSMDRLAQSIEKQMEVMSSVVTTLSSSLDGVSKAAKKAGSDTAATVASYKKTSAAISGMTDNLEKVINKYGNLPEASRKPLENLKKDFNSIQKVLGTLDDSNIEELNKATQKWTRSLATNKIKLAENLNAAKGVGKSPQEKPETDLAKEIERYVVDKGNFQLNLKMPDESGLDSLNDKLGHLGDKLGSFGQVETPAVFQDLIDAGNELIAAANEQGATYEDLSDKIKEYNLQLGIANSALSAHQKKMRELEGIQNKASTTYSTARNKVKKLFESFSDVKGAEAHLESLRKALETLDNELSSNTLSQAGVKKAQDAFNESTDKTETSLKSLKKQNTEHAKYVKELTTNLRQYVNVTRDAEQTVNKLKSRLEGISGSEKVIQKVEASFGKLKDVIDVASVDEEYFAGLNINEFYSDFKSEIGGLESEIKGLIKAQKEADQQVKEDEKTRKKVNSILRGTSENITDLIIKYKGIKGSEKLIESLKDRHDSLIKSLLTEGKTAEKVASIMEDYGSDIKTINRQKDALLQANKQEEKQLNTNRKALQELSKARKELRKVESSASGINESYFDTSSITEPAREAFSELEKILRSTDTTQEELTKGLDAFSEKMGKVNDDLSAMKTKQKGLDDQLKQEGKVKKAVDDTRYKKQREFTKLENDLAKIAGSGDLLRRVEAIQEGLINSLDFEVKTMDDLNRVLQENQLLLDGVLESKSALIDKNNEFAKTQKEAEQQAKIEQTLRERIQKVLHDTGEKVKDLAFKYEGIKGSESIIQSLIGSHDNLRRSLLAEGVTAKQLTNILQGYETELKEIERQKERLVAANKKEDAQRKASHSAAMSLSDAETTLNRFELSTKGLKFDHEKVLAPAEQAFEDLSNVLLKTGVTQEEVKRETDNYARSMRALGVELARMKDEQKVVLTEEEKLYKKVSDKIYDSKRSVDSLIESYRKIKGSEALIRWLEEAHSDYSVTLQRSAKSLEDVENISKDYVLILDEIGRTKNKLVTANKEQAESERKLKAEQEKAAKVQENAASSVETYVHNSSEALKNLIHKYKDLEGGAEHLRKLQEMHERFVETLAREGTTTKKALEIFRAYDTQVGVVVRSLKDIKSEQGKEEAALRGVTRAVSELEREYSKLGRSTENLSAVKKAADAYRSAVQEHGANSSQAASALGDFNNKVKEQKNKLQQVRDPIGEFNSQMAEVSATAQLIYGPLSGVASRITAFAGVARRTSMSIAALVASLAALAGSATLMVRFGTEQELILAQFRSQLLTTKRATEDTADALANDMEKIAKSLAIDTLTSTHEARQAVANILSFSTITTGEVERIVSVSQDMAHVTGNTLVESAKRLGKALESPGEVIEGLSDVGITFTETEKDMMKQMVLTGEAFEARNYILQQVQDRMNEVAKDAASNTLAGAFDTVVERFNHMFAAAAQTSGVLDSFKSVLGSVDAILKSTAESAEKGEGILVAFGKVLSVIADAFNFIVESIRVVIEHFDKLAISAAVIAAITLATQGWITVVAVLSVGFLKLAVAMKTVELVFKSSLFFKGAIGVAIIGAAFAFDYLSKRTEASAEEMKELNNDSKELLGTLDKLSKLRSNNTAAALQKRVVELKSVISAYRAMPQDFDAEFGFSKGEDVRKAVLARKMLADAIAELKDVEEQLAETEGTDARDEKARLKGIIELSAEYAKVATEARDYGMSLEVLNALQEDFNFSVKGSAENASLLKAAFEKAGLVKTDEDFRRILATINAFYFELENNSPFEKAKRNLNSLREELAKANYNTALTVNLGSIKANYETDTLAQELYDSISGSAPKAEELAKILNIDTRELDANLLDIIPLSADDISEAIKRIKRDISFAEIMDSARTSAVEYAKSIGDIGKIVKAEGLLLDAQAKEFATKFASAIEINDFTPKQISELKEALQVDGLGEDDLIAYFKRLKKEADIRSVLQSIKELQLELAKSANTVDSVTLAFNIEKDVIEKEAREQALAFMSAFKQATDEKGKLAASVGLKIDDVDTEAVEKYFSGAKQVIAARGEVQSFTSSIQDQERELNQLAISYARAKTAAEQLTDATEKSASIASIEAENTRKATEIQNKYALSLVQSKIAVQNLLQEYGRVTNKDFSITALKDLEAEEKALQLIQGKSLSQINEDFFPAGDETFGTMTEALVYIKQLYLDIAKVAEEVDNGTKLKEAKSSLIEIVRLASEIGNIDNLTKIVEIEGVNSVSEDNISNILFELELMQEQEEEINALEEAFKEYGLTVSEHQKQIYKGMLRENKARELTGDLIRELGEVSMTETQKELADIDREYQERVKLLQATGQIKDKQAELDQWYNDQKMRAASDLYTYLKDADREWADSLADTLLDSEKNFADFTRSIAQRMANLAISDTFTRLFGAIRTSLPSLSGTTTVPTPAAPTSIYDIVPQSGASIGFRNAHGNIFNGDLVPFAKGGAFTNSIVNKPTTFPFASGIGLMGEAGAEAIMPLTRLSGGDLGVKAIGAGGSDVIVQIIDQRSSGATPSVQRSQDANGREIIKVLIREEVQGMINSGAMDKTMTSNYGLKRQGFRR